MSDRNAFAKIWDQLGLRTFRPKLTIAWILLLAVWLAGGFVTAGVGVGFAVIMAESGAIFVSTAFFESDFIVWYVPKSEGVVVMPRFPPVFQLLPEYHDWGESGRSIDLPLYLFAIAVTPWVVAGVRRRAARA